MGPSEASKLPAFLPSVQRITAVAVAVAAVAAVGVGLYFARHTVAGSTINAKLFTLYSMAQQVNQNNAIWRAWSRDYRVCTYHWLDPCSICQINPH